MTFSAPHNIRFPSGDSMIAALHYTGANGACIVMAFDFRRLGESGGSPRQVVRIDDQLDDYRAAIAFAATLPEVDPTKIAIWGFSLAGGHVLRVAAREPGLAAAIAQAPLVDGPA